ncbi:MAG: CoA transferase [Candidatus Binataceae bacterium]|nr:CoA transferase [Candidatus Binataceae bacterium]
MQEPSKDSTPPFAGLRVIECGEGVAAAFAARLMADLGAEVIKVEPPDGDLTRRRGPFPNDRPDPEQSGLFIYLNAGKLGITLDLTHAADRATLSKLLAHSDLLLHNVPVPQRSRNGLDSARLAADFPHLVIGAVSPFGDSGPYRDWKAYEINIVNAGGWTFVNPGSSESPDLPPLKTFGALGDFQAGLHLCFAALTALWRRLAIGSGDQVEVSGQECIAAMLELTLVHYTYGGRLASRLGRRAVAPWTIMECADGYIMLLAIEEDQWQRMVAMMGDPQWAHEEIFATGALRSAHCEALYALMGEWVRQWKVQDLFLEAQRRRIPVAPVSTMRDLYACEQLIDRKFFLPIEIGRAGAVPMPGAPFQSSAGGWQLRGPAPRLGQHNARSHREGNLAQRAPGLIAGRAKLPPPRDAKPLAGIRILDLTWVWAGPYSTMQFAYMGAEVIRVESRTRLCPTRRVPPFADDISGVNRAGYFNQYSQGKRSMLLNLSDPEGVRIALELAKHCDLVAENFSAGAMDRLGLGYQRLRAVKRDIIMVSMSGFGQSGPWKNFLSYGPSAAALAGFFGLSGYTGMGPSQVGLSFADPTAGMFAAVAVMAALFHRARTGEGQYIDVSQLEATLALLPEGLLDYALNATQPPRVGNHDRWMAPHDCYKALGDENQWVSIAVGNEDEWRALCDAIGQPALAGDPRFKTAGLRKLNEPALDEIITGWTVVRDRWDVARRLQSHGVAAFPAMSNVDLAADPHLNERGFLVRLDHPEVGRRIQAGIPWTMAATPCRLEIPAPLLGADTDSVLRGLLKLSEEEIVRLRSAGVLS